MILDLFISKFNVSNGIKSNYKVSTVYMGDLSQTK